MDPSRDLIDRLVNIDRLERAVGLRGPQCTALTSHRGGCTLGAFRHPRSHSMSSLGGALLARAGASPRKLLDLLGALQVVTRTTHTE
jgi:hypothetical protein